MRGLLTFLTLTLGAGGLPGQVIDTVKHTRTIKLTERVGVERVRFPIEATVRFETKDFKNAGDVRLARVDGGRKVPVPVQVLQVTAHDATDSFAPAPQTFVQIVFPADVPANGTATYEVSLGGPNADAPTPALKVAGDGVGRSVDTGPVLFELHKPSGQLMAFTPKGIAADRLVFQQDPKAGPLPFHWNPDIWKTGGRWGHTSDWNAATAFDPAKHKADALPAGDEKTNPYFYREWNGPLAYRLTRWGKMPFVPQVDVSVTYTFFAGSPFVAVRTLMEFREGVALHAVRDAELVFSRHQFDTAVWLGKDGKLQTATCYDYNDKDRSFKEVARLAPDTPCLGLANERKGYGIGLAVLSTTNLNKLTGGAADEQAHFYIRDYDEHGKGSPANFLYFVRPLVYRDGYLPTGVAAGSVYAATSAVVVFPLDKDPAKKYGELTRWQKALASPLEIVAD